MAENNDDDSVEPESDEDSQQAEASGRATTELAVKQTLEFSGPLPPPQLLKGYNDAFAGCAERVVAMAERQSAHRQELEKKIIESNCEAQTRGQWFAFILALVVIGGGVYLLAQGKSLEGFSAIIIALGSLIGTLVYGRSAQRKEREHKMQNFPRAPRPPLPSNDSGSN